MSIVTEQERRKGSHSNEIDAINTQVMFFDQGVYDASELIGNLSAGLITKKEFRRKVFQVEKKDEMYKSGFLSEIERNEYAARIIHSVRGARRLRTQYAG